jgi:hypothetical protein
MMPTERIDRSGTILTIAEMIRTAVEFGMDRISAVRPPEDGKKAAVMILMLSQAAVRELGSFLRDHIEDLNQAKTTILIDYDSSIPKIFEAMDSMASEWGWVKLENQAMAVVIVGDSITKQFAAELTKRGCTTNLK